MTRPDVVVRRAGRNRYTVHLRAGDVLIGRLRRKARRNTSGGFDIWYARLPGQARSYETNTRRDAVAWLCEEMRSRR